MENLYLGYDYTEELEELKVMVRAKYPLAENFDLVKREDIEKKICYKSICTGVQGVVTFFLIAGMIGNSFVYTISNQP